MSIVFLHSHVFTVLTIVKTIVLKTRFLIDYGKNDDP